MILRLACGDQEKFFIKSVLGYYSIGETSYQDL